jgi:hypothetical protein
MNEYTQGMMILSPLAKIGKPRELPAPRAGCEGHLLPHGFRPMEKRATAYAAKATVTPRPMLDRSATYWRD